MSARKDSLAGSAYVRLRVDNSAFVKGIQDARARLQSMGAAMMSVGAKTTAVGSAIVGAFAAAGNHFASTGDKLDKMAARTGIAEDKLSALGFAAQQSGATMDDVGQAVQRMNRRLGRITAGEGTSSQVNAMEELGLSLSDIQSMNPEQRFMALADAMSQYGDDAAAAGLAQRAFGTGVDKLLPLFADGSKGIKELMQEAKELGVVMSTEDADAAAKLTDAMGRVKSTLSAVVQQIGSAVAPIMEDMANKFAKVTSKVIAWVKENKNLVVMAAKVGAAIMVAGAAITAIGATLIGASVAFGALSVAFGALVVVAKVVGAAIAFLVSPIGLVTAAVVGATVAFFKFTDVGKRTMDTLRNKLVTGFTRIKEIAITAFGGIRDAIQEGDWAMAGQIAMAALKLTFAEGVEGIATMVDDTFGETFGGLTRMILGGDFVGAWDTVVSAMSNTWHSFMQGIVAGAAEAARGTFAIWNGMIQSIVDKAAEGGTFGDVFKAITGIDAEVAKEQDEKTKRMNARLKQKLTTGITDTEQNLEIATAAGDQEKIEEYTKELERLTHWLNEANSTDPISVVDAISGSLEIPDYVSDAVQEIQTGAEQLQREAEEALNQGLDEATSNAQTAASERIQSLREDLVRLRKEASEAVDKSKREGQSSYGVLAAEGGPGGSGGTDGERGTGRASAATFSARAALAMSQGSGESPTVKATEGVKKAIVKSETVLADLLTQVNINIKNQSLHHP